MIRRQARVMITVLTVNQAEMGPYSFLHTAIGPSLLRLKFSFWIKIISVRLQGGVGNRKLRSLLVREPLLTSCFERTAFLYVSSSEMFDEFICDGIKSPTSCRVSDHLNHQIQEVTPASRCLGGERRAQGVGEIFQENFCK